MTGPPEPVEPPRRRALVMCAFFEPGYRGGGPIRSVARLVDALPEDFAADLITRDHDLGAARYRDLSGRWVRRGATDVYYLPMALAAGRRLVQELHGRRYDVLYLNSLFDPLFAIGPLLAARLGVLRAGQILLAPRGELSPGALRLKGRKKRCVLLVLRPLLASLPVTWHCTSQLEAGQVSAVFPRARRLVASPGAGPVTEPLAPQPTGTERAAVVFISRICPKKNLLVAIEAAQRLRHPLRLDIYGPIEDRAYFARCLAAAEHVPPGVEVRYQGELAASEVRDVFNRYDAFVFPTLGENYGHVVAESLSASCPVVCSAETPWSAVLTGGGGRVVPELSAHSLGAELAHIAAATPAQRWAARERAGEQYRRWARQRPTSRHPFSRLVQ